MENSFIAWIFLMSFALVGPGLVFLLVSYVRGDLTQTEETRWLPTHAGEEDYWQQTWPGGDSR